MLSVRVRVRVRVRGGLSASRLVLRQEERRGVAPPTPAPDTAASGAGRHHPRSCADAGAWKMAHHHLHGSHGLLLPHRRAGGVGWRGNDVEAMVSSDSSAPLYLAPDPRSDCFGMGQHRHCVGVQVGL